MGNEYNKDNKEEEKKKKNVKESYTNMVTEKRLIIEHKLYSTYKRCVMRFLPSLTPTLFPSFSSFRTPRH